MEHRRDLVDVDLDPTSPPLTDRRPAAWPLLRAVNRARTVVGASASCYFGDQGVCPISERAVVVGVVGVAGEHERRRPPWRRARRASSDAASDQLAGIEWAADHLQEGAA
jgi:hypothetical protein